MTRNPVPLTFATDADGVLRHVDDVSSGLACGCLCPACGSRMVARHGVQTVHHFAHTAKSECVDAVEAALHLAVVEVLLRERRMTLPSLVQRAVAEDSSGRTHVGGHCIRSRTVTFDEVSVEVRPGGGPPRIVARVRGRTLQVELAVGHHVSPEDTSALRDRGVAAVEVDLSGAAQGWTWASLTEAIVANSAGKNWLFNPKSEALQAEARRDAEALADRTERRSSRRDHA